MTEGVNAPRTGRFPGPHPILQARQGALHQPPRPRPHLGARPAARRRERRLHRGILASAAAQLRAGAVDRPRVRRRVPGRGAPRGALDPPRSSSCPTRLAPVLPAGIEMQRAVTLPAGADSLQQAVTSCTWHIEVADIAPPDAAAGVGAGAGRHRARVDPRAQGQHRHRRRAARHPRPACARPRHRGRRTARSTAFGPGHGAGGRAGHPAPRAAPGRARRRRRPDVGRGAVTRIHQWTQAGGARREVVDLGPAATPPPHAEVRAS